jgi:hypothetical protein
MFETTASAAIGGAGGATLLAIMVRMLFKQFSSGLVDLKSDRARSDIIGELRTEVDRVRSRLDLLEQRVTKLTDRLVVVRGHALMAYSIVGGHEVLNQDQRLEVLEALTQIIKED